ncbi:sulfatase [Reichenbachiella versicolor]|uniref:sulfatase n=1 Tax=Reichenbachiella versicolor TaxID=1821036 RepID=UPI000D6DF73B|nr:sulfatase [Reichenbachiella versicolor]
MVKNLVIVLAILASSVVISCSRLNGASKNDSITKGNSRPNIVLLFVDDQGWGDLEYRRDYFETPNLAEFKAQAVDFTRAYIPTPTCSPSRASLATGKEAARLQMVRHIGHENTDGSNDSKYSFWKKDPVQMPSINWLPLEEVTYAEKLREYGYYNAFVGKWHLGHEPFHPIHQGWDIMYGTGNAGHPKSYYYPFFNGSELKDRKDGEYLTTVLTDGAIEFIEGYNDERPFMLSLWYYTVHGPFVGRKDLLQKYIDKGLPKAEAHYAAMVEAMDESIGRVREAIEDKGISDNTVVIYLSDQGGKFSNAPLSGGKIGGNTLGEGGARVPFMMYYPGVSVAGSEINTPIQSIDLFPTLMEIATGHPYEDNNIQGQSLLPLIRGEKPKSSRQLFFFRSYEDQRSAVIEGDWKLIRYHSGKYQLFNVADDISEQNNLIDMESELAERLKVDLAKWEAEAIPANNGSLILD